MRIFALELINETIETRKRQIYIEILLEHLENPDFVVLPELALTGYKPSRDLWQYADEGGRNTAAWAVEMAKKYNTYIGIGYLDKEYGDYYNRYMIVGPEGRCGTVTKSEGEPAVFKRGKFDSIIRTPFGNVGVAIGQDSKRKHFYDNVKTEELSMIIFPHGCLSKPKKPEKEQKINHSICKKYAEAFAVPVVYVIGRAKGMEHISSKMDSWMYKEGFEVFKMSKIYAPDAVRIKSLEVHAVAAEVNIMWQMQHKEISFYGDELIKRNRILQKLISEPNIKKGIKSYEQHAKK